MRRAHRVAALSEQQLLGRPVRRHRIAGRLDRAVAELALVIGEELAAQVPFGLGRVLVLVQADGGSVPDVDFRPGHRAAHAIDHLAGEEQGNPRGRGPDDGAAVWGQRRAGAPERAEQVGGGLAAVPVVHQTDQGGEAETAGDQAGLVVAGRGQLAEAGHQVDGLVELLLGQAHLAGESVQVPDQRLQDLLEPRIGRPMGLVEHRLGELDFVLDDHASPPAGRPSRGQSA